MTGGLSVIVCCAQPAQTVVEQINLALFSGVLVVYDSLDFVCDSL